MPHWALSTTPGGLFPAASRISFRLPRPNGYQSLHTSVIAGGQPFEVQIRTAEMHRIAEEGIAAHWKYKDGKLVADSKEDERISWLRHLVEWQQEMKDPDDFMSTLKVDLYPEEVYTFTPKGKVITLPRDATPVDFAYAIHTEVGHNCVGAKINGRMVPLKTKLKNGDIVEISTQTGTQAQPRLAVIRQDVASSQQDSSLAHGAGKREGDRTGQEGFRKGSAEVQTEPEGNPGERKAQGAAAGLRRRKDRRPVVFDRVRKDLGEAGSCPACCRMA